MTTRLRAFARAHAGSAASLVVLAIVAKAILGRVGTFDLGFDDECWILGEGLGLPARPLPPSDYGPLYAVWYRVMGALAPDPVKLYSFNWVVLELGLASLLYALSRRSGAPRLAAGLVTIAWSLSHAVMIWPFAVYFSTAILALGALAATSATRDGLAATTILSIATAVASFVRPELAIPGIALVSIAVLWSVARATRERRPRALAPALVVALSVAGLVRIFGVPVGGGRGYFAFEQHYALNRVEAGHLRADPWSGYRPIVEAAFPHARSIGEAARENPGAFAWHVAQNASLLPKRLAWLFEIDAYVPLAVKLAITWGAGAALVLGALAIARRRRRLSPRLVAWLPTWIPVGASFLAAVLLIRPRDHYLVPFGFFALATLASACGALARRRRPAPLATLTGLAAAVTLLMILPTYRRGALPSLMEARGGPPPTDFDVRRTALALRAIGLRGERVILEPEWSRAIYAGVPVRRVEPSTKTGPFFAFLRDHDVDLVIASPRLQADARFRDDPEFRSFLADGGDHRGFVLRKIPGSQTIIAYRPTERR